MATSAARITSGSKGWMTGGSKRRERLPDKNRSHGEGLGQADHTASPPKELLRFYGWEHWQLKDTRTRHGVGGLMARDRAIEDCDQRTFVLPM